MDPGGWHVQPDAVAADFTVGQQGRHDLADAAEPGALVPAAEELLEAAQGDVLEEGQGPARLQQARHDFQEPPHVVDGEIVQRQPGDDEVVLLPRRQIFHGTVQHAGTVGHCLKGGLGLQPPAEALNKTGVEFHQIQPVLRAKDVDQASGDGPRARPDFQDPPRVVGRLRGESGQGHAQAPPTGQNRPGRVEVAAKLAEKKADVRQSRGHEAKSSRPLAATPGSRGGGCDQRSGRP